MIIIKYNMLKKEYQRLKPPTFKTRMDEILWLKNEKMNYELLNIKYIYISKEDILMMKNSNDINLNNIYNKYKGYSGEYIKILNNEENKKIIYSILKTEWLIVLNNFMRSSKEELNNTIDETNKKIEILKERKTTDNLSIYLNNNIKLSEYKKEKLYNEKKYNNRRKKIKYKNKRHI